MAQAQTTEGATEIIDAVRFSFMTDEEVRKHSFLKLTNPILLDTVDRPVPSGLYDPILGPLDERAPCKTCGHLRLNCPGHCGHIELVYPVYNPLLFNFLHSLIQKTCFFCHHFRIERNEVESCVSRLKLIIKGDVVGAKELSSDSPSVSSYSEDSDWSHETCSTVLSGAHDQDAGQPKFRQWTSLQFAEANAVLNKFMKLKTAKCKRCKAKNPSVNKPVFGWFQMAGMSGASIRANVIQGHEMGDPLGSVEDCNDITQEGNTPGCASYGHENDATKKSGKKSEKLHLEFTKQKNSRHLLPTEVKEIVKLLWQNEPEICLFIGNLQQYGFEKKVDYSMFFLESVLVPPTKFRAPTKGGDSVMEHPQTVLLGKVLQSNISLGNARANNVDQSKIVSRWMDLQQSINILYDGKSAAGQGQREMGTGICQLLEKKEGLFRQKMMGKRVNFACRSVISPDPYLAVNEIGIPPCFALKLTYPERVTPWNLGKLREAIINGSDIHPGATHYSDKLTTMRLPLNQKMRIAISRKLPSSKGALVQSGKSLDNELEGKIVYRHLQDGDVVLVNRQPTLHKPSIMAHVVRVLKGEKTIRMHYANCSTYNADFDGDEMNVHFPQDEISRAEAYNIVNANNQYVRPSSGEPLRALIQDHIVSAALLTKKDTFLNREEFNQLLYSSGVSVVGLGSASGKPGKKVSIWSSEGDMLPILPAIWKPKPLWTGKQVITAVLNHITKGCPPFTVEKAGKLPRDFFKSKSIENVMSKRKWNDKDKVMKKKQKSVYTLSKERECADENESEKLVDNEDKLLIYKNDFVRGVIDKAQFADYGLVHTVQELYGSNTAGLFLSALSRLSTVFLQMRHGLTCGLDDLLIKKDKDDARTRQLEECDHIGEKVLCKALGIKAEAKIDPKELKSKIERTICSDGDAALTSLDRSIVNELNQCTSKGIMNELLSEGLLKPTGKNWISLMTTSGAKGSKVNFQQISSHLGQQELEGKRVPRMVSGKTLPCFHPWDWAPRAGGFISDRFLTGLRPQEYYFHCMAGREGLVDTAVKTSRSGYLQRCLIKNLESLKVSYDYTVRDADGSIIQFQYGEDGVDVHRTSFIAKFKELTANQDMILEACGRGTTFDTSNHYITELPSALKKKAEKFVKELPLNDRVALNLVKQEELLKLLKSRFLSSLAQPGEPVGVLAAQSVGEPSTQMTLNTFHLAGRGEMNVTLGIPRLQEILMTASNDLKTPIMTCPLREGRTKEDANRLADRLRKIAVADIIEKMEVSVVPFAIQDNQICSIHKLKMKLYKPEHYPEYTDISVEDWEDTLQISYLRELEDAIQNHLVLLSRISGIKNFMPDSRPKASNETDEDFSASESRRVEDDDDSGDDDGQDVEDLGSDAQKRKKQTTDEMDYEDGSEEEINEEFSHVRVEGDNSDIENEDEIEISKDDIIELRDGKGEVSKSSVKPSKDDAFESQLSEKPSKSKSRAEKTKSETKRTKKVKAKFFKKETDRAVFIEAKGLEFEVHFKFVNEPHILLAQIAQKTAKKVYIQNSGRIERCQVGDCSDGQVIYYGKDPKDRKDIKTEDKKSIPALNAAGIDLVSFWQLQDHLDVRYIYCNSVHAMLNTYGVEAARETIIREINHVFKSYGISVNIRHLTLIADYMTHTGGYRPMSRLGGIADSTSPFAKMSFETASKFILHASQYGEADNLETPSARICLGLPVKMGTGCFDLMQKLEV